ncbi:MAG TPA: ABC transporter permease [Bryobacteraceae bacterium]|nr:ABC transporter permease [Bryobacteraceae bacterium]
MNLRVALRNLRRAPAFAVFSIVELALGIGLTTSAFFVIYAVLLRPLDLPEPSQMVQIQNTNRRTGRVGSRISGLDFKDLRDQTQVFTAMAAYSDGDETILVGKRPEKVFMAMVSRGWQETLGVQPMLGRGLFSEGTNETGALVSEQFWRSRMGSDPAVLGRSIVVEGQSFAIKGVMPDRGVYPEKSEIWVPVVPENDGASRTAFNYSAIARLKPGVTLDQAKANLAAVSANLERQYPKENQNLGYTAIDLRERLVGNYRTMLLTLGGAVFLVLIIACANVTNLLLARALDRRRELAIRMALGGRARDLFAAVLSESILIGVLGGAAGVLLAMWARRLLLTANPFPIPRLGAAGMDLVVLGFALLASLACGCFTGVLPAWRIWRSDVQHALAQASASRAVVGGSERLRSSLLVAEIAFSVLLLVGAGLLVRSFARLSAVDPGFKVENLTLMECDLSAISSDSAAQKNRFFEEMRGRALGFPGVAAAAWNRDLPARATLQAGGVLMEGRAMPSGSAIDKLYATWHMAGPDVFQTLGVPLLMGRTFTAQDNRSAPDVAIVNAEFVRTFLAGENPIGRRFQIGLDRADPITIIGVVGNIRELAQPAGPELYLPYLQHMQTVGAMYLTIRSTGNAAPLIDALRRSAANLMPEAAVRFTTMEKAIAETVAPARFRTLSLTVFAGIALLLALAGLYAVCSYAVQSRTREIGLRMAMGAAAGTVVRQFVVSALRLTAIGLAIGIAVAFASRNVLASFLYDLPPSDWLSYVATAAVVALGAAVASSIPAWRASRTDPAVVLREE